MICLSIKQIRRRTQEVRIQKGEAVLKLKYTFDLVEVDDHIVAVPVSEGANAYHGVVKLNESAAFIFKLLQDETSEDAVVKSMLDEFDAPEESLVSAVHNCISELRNKDLLTE